MKLTLEDFYPDISSLVVNHKFLTDFEIEDDKIHFSSELMKEKICIHTSQLDKLSYGVKPDGIKRLKYLESYGVCTNDYCEVAIDIRYNGLMPLEDGNVWKTSPLKFRIGNSQIEVGAASQLFVLLTEPIYSDNQFGYYEFDQFASIKCSVEEGDDPLVVVSKVLYYLNSQYLKRIHHFAEIFHLEIEYSDPMDLMYDNEIGDVFSKATRRTNLLRRDFKDIEPLNLYSKATVSIGTTKFMYLYRILEFFMDRSMMQYVDEIRNDKTITNKELMKLLKLRDEPTVLNHLISAVLNTNNRKKRILGRASHLGLISDQNVKNFVKSLYAYRNSIVHAKESQKERTEFPSPFVREDKNHAWLSIVDEFAINCIKRFNTLPKNKIN